MASVMSAIKDTISISVFNRGMAGKVFDEVKRTGAKVVMKNNSAECVLLSPDEYTRLMDEINDARLLTTALNRMAHFDSSSLMSFDEVKRELGISDEDLANFNEVEFE